MIVLGVDPGSYTTGYAFLETGKSGPRVLEYGSIACRAKDPLEDRLVRIILDLEKLLDTYRPEVLSMESAFFAKNVRSAMVLGHVRGAILVACHRRGLDFAEYSPRSVKQAVTGNGAASKEMVARMVQTRLRLKEVKGPLDASDALAIALTHLNPPAVRPPRSSKKNKNQALKELVLRMGGTLP
jgi:crossover junction endodeoxyribonuclease RuvC